MEAIFETAEERRERTRRTLVFVLILLIIAAGITGLYLMYETVKPLPQVKACADAGFPGGMISPKGEAVCFNDCRTKNLFECKMIKVIHK